MTEAEIITFLENMNRKLDLMLATLEELGLTKTSKPAKLGS